MSQEQECGVIDMGTHCKGSGKGIGALVTVVQGCDECGCEAAEQTASDALKAAEEAQKAADAAAERAEEAYEKALGYYTVDPHIQDLNTFFTAPEKRWLTHAASVNAPFQAGFPAYFEVRLNSDRTSAMQVFRSVGDDAVTWFRFAAVDQTNPQSPSVVWTDWRTDVRPDSMSTVLNADGTISVQLRDDGGLGVDGNGLYVNPGTLSDETLGGLLDQLRLPKLLTKSTTWFVRADGDDDNDGLSNNPEGAFHTIQGALNVIASKYNIGTCTATISVQPGTYAGFTLPQYTVSTGDIRVEGTSTAEVVVKGVNESLINSVKGAGTYYLRNLTVHLTMNAGVASGIAAITANTGVDIHLYNLHIDLDEESGATASFAALSCIGGGLSIRYGNAISTTSQAATTHMIPLHSISGGVTLLREPFSINGITQFTAYASSLGIIRRSGSMEVTVSGSVTGQRYRVEQNSIINTFGSGSSFFPGTVAGNTATGGQYS